MLTDPLPALEMAQARRVGWAQTKRELKSGTLSLFAASERGFPSTLRAMEAIGMAVVGAFGHTSGGGTAGRHALSISRQLGVTHWTYASQLSAERWADAQRRVDQAVAAVERRAVSLTAAS